MPFVVIEGIDGAGKTTQVKLLGRRLEELRVPYLLVSDPGHTALGKRIHALINHRGEVSISPAAELFLFYAARTQLVNECIAPALKRGMLVVSDRFQASTLAYQAGGRGIPPKLLASLEKLAVADCEPDLQILLSIDWERARRRLNRAEPATSFEKESARFFSKVERAYAELAKQNPRQWRVLDATAAPQDISEGIFDAIAPFLPQ